MLKAHLGLVSSLLVWLFAMVESVEILHKPFLGNFNNSLFTGFLFTQQDAVCYNDREHALIGFADKVADSANPQLQKSIASFNRETVQFNLSNSLVYFNYAYKSIEQRLQLSATPEVPLASLTVQPEATANSYTVTFSFENANCQVSIPAIKIDTSMSMFRKVDCSSDSGYTSITTNIILINTYQCDLSTTNPSANLRTAIPGLRIDMNVTFQPSTAFRSSFSPNSYQMPQEMTLEYADIYKSVDYLVQFGTQEPDGSTSQLRISMGYIETI